MDQQNVCIRHSKCLGSAHTSSNVHSHQILVVRLYGRHYQQSMSLFETQFFVGSTLFTYHNSLVQKEFRMNSIPAMVISCL